jgi:DNA replicative helicase MCM subunit Mcm2 (Cdc46/Mcm family)
MTVILKVWILTLIAFISIKGSQVGQCKPGDEIVVVGILIRRWLSKKLVTNSRPDAIFCVEANSVYVTEKQSKFLRSIKKVFICPRRRRFSYSQKNARWKHGYNSYMWRPNRTLLDGT